MVQAELTETLRIHIWHPSLRTIEGGHRDIHDHRFDLTSAVVLGEIYDVPCAVTNLPRIGEGTSHRQRLDDDLFEEHGPMGSKEVAFQTSQAWEIVHAKAQAEYRCHSADLAKWIAQVEVSERTPRRIEAGDSYFIPKREFHTTRIHVPAVTVVHRGSFDSKPARVLADTKEFAESAMVKAPDEPFLRFVIDDVIHSLEMT